MSKDVMLFDFQDQPVRVVHVDGQPWFVLADLCRVLDIANPRDTAQRVPLESVGTADVLDSRGVSHPTNIVDEPGMYEVVFLSRKPEAAAFRRWITTEVLPAIRQTGHYGTPQLTGPELMAAALVEAQRTLDAATQRAERAEQQAQASQRVVRAIEANDGITLTQFHKHYFSDIPERTFFEFLYARKLLINQRGARGRGPDGRLRDGKEHRHPTAKGKRYLYLHGSLDREGVRREHVRVRPGAPEVELVRFLYHRGLTPNENAVAVIEGTALVEVV